MQVTFCRLSNEISSCAHFFLWPLLANLYRYKIHLTIQMLILSVAECLREELPGLYKKLKMSHK